MKIYSLIVALDPKKNEINFELQNADKKWFGLLKNGNFESSLVSGDSNAESDKIYCPLNILAYKPISSNTIQ